MCEANVWDGFTPAGFVACIGSGSVTIEFPNSRDLGAWQYGRALKEKFPILPSDPQECVKLVRDMANRGLISVAVAGASEADRDHTPTYLQATISAGHKRV